jgi:hypothetical protein
VYDTHDNVPVKPFVTVARHKNHKTLLTRANDSFADPISWLGDLTKA